MISNKALNVSNCQFKLLRENSLLHLPRFKEIHTRATQDAKGRPVYAIPSDNIKKNIQIKSKIPMIQQSFRPFIKLLKKKLDTKKNPAKAALKTSPAVAAAIIKTPKITKKEVKKLEKAIAKAKATGHTSKKLKEFLAEQKKNDECEIEEK
jgi:hypothetical protein